MPKSILFPNSKWKIPNPTKYHCSIQMSQILMESFAKRKLNLNYSQLSISQKQKWFQPTTVIGILIPLFSSSELTGCGYPGLLDRKNRLDMCRRWESNPRLPACKASTLSTRPGSPLEISTCPLVMLYIYTKFCEINWNANKVIEWTRLLYWNYKGE